MSPALSEWQQLTLWTVRERGGRVLAVLGDRLDAEHLARGHALYAGRAVELARGRGYLVVETFEPPAQPGNNGETKPCRKP